MIKLNNNSQFFLKTFFKQFFILNWKNYILLKRNWIGTIFEISLSAFFILTLLIIRNIIERIYVPEQINPSYYLIDYFQTLSGRNLILFYPNSPLVERVVRNAISIIKARKYWLNFSSLTFILSVLSPFLFFIFKIIKINTQKLLVQTSLMP